MRRRALIVLVIIALAVSAVYLGASDVFARGGGHGGHGWGGGHDGRYYHHGGRYYYRSGWWWIGAAATTLALGSILADLPDGYTTVYYGNRPYYYYDGLYYKPCPNGYAVVNAPVGVVVPTIPEVSSPVIVNGVTYYNTNGVTYMAAPNGYQVVQQIPQAQPAMAQPAPASVQAQQTEAAGPICPPSAGNTFTINVPDAKGGYASVTLTKKGTGYVGPQGEFYAECPKVSQLKEMYGK